MPWSEIVEFYFLSTNVKETDGQTFEGWMRIKDI